MKKRLKEQRGFTLVELLAVIVILGIIAAIAVPAIGNIIEKSREDAFAASAQQMVESGRLAATSESKIHNGHYTLALGYLIDKGYIEAISDPFGEGYQEGEEDVRKEPQEVKTTDMPAYSYVTVENGSVTEVFLTNGIRTIEGNNKDDTNFNADLVGEKVTGGS